MSVDNYYNNLPEINKLEFKQAAFNRGLKNLLSVELTDLETELCQMPLNPENPVEFMLDYATTRARKSYIKELLELLQQVAIAHQEEQPNPQE